MWEIPIFAAEKKDGIDHLVRSNASIAYTSPAKAVEKAKQEIIQSIYDKTTAAANKGQMDLFYLDTILVTTGWNLNDDIFVKEPTWAARHTPEDKPFNYGHNQLDIIGHITSNCAVDCDYTAIADDSVLDDVPDKFHILTSAVIYKAWADKDQAERIEKIIAEIGEDKWFVSMECLFRGFNYGFYDAKGDCRIVARDEESAFLTKHLRAYGGTGKYKGDKIGRVISNLVFSGKGLVEKPANPESIIFNNVASFKSTFANLGYINSSEVDNLNNNEELNMADTEKTVSELSKALELLQAEKAALAKELKDSQTQAAKASEDKVNSLVAAVDEEKKKTKVAEDKTAKAEAELEEVRKELTVAKSDNDAMKKTIDEFKKAGKTSKAGLTEEEATAFLLDWADADEKTFDKALALVQKAKAGSGSLDKPDTVKKVAEIKPGDDSGAQKVNAGGTATTTDNLGTAAAAVNSGVEGNSGAAAAANVVADAEVSRAALSEFIGKSLKNQKSRKR
jgi:hypothetical protein